MPANDTIGSTNNAWNALKTEMRNNLHPCGSHAFCHMVQKMVGDWKAEQSRYPHWCGREFPSPKYPRFFNLVKSYGWNKPREYNGGLLGEITKATNRRTAQAIALAWPIWRDGPSQPKEIEDVQVLMYWAEMFRGCSITNGTNSNHQHYVRRIQRMLAEHDEAVRPYERV